MVSIIVCTHNGSSRILPTLQALEKCISEVADASRIELLVIGNVCADDTADVVRDFWANQSAAVTRRFFDESTLGLTAARLRGFEESRGELVILCDDDVVPSPTAVLQMIRTAEAEPQVGGGGGVIHAELLNGAVWPGWFNERLRLFLAVREIPEGPIYSPPNPDGTFYPPGAFVWWRKEAITAWMKEANQPGFHLDRRGNQLWSAGDMEINHAVLAAGFQLKHDPAIEAWHRIPPQRLQVHYVASLLYWIGRSLQRMNHRHSYAPWRSAVMYVVDRARRNPAAVGKDFWALTRPLKKRYSIAGLSDTDVAQRLYDLIGLGEDDEKLLKFLQPWRH